jgi:hypothetical protein
MARKTKKKQTSIVAALAPAAQTDSTAKSLLIAKAASARAVSAQCQAAATGFKMAQRLDLIVAEVFVRLAPSTRAASSVPIV